MSIILCLALNTGSRNRDYRSGVALWSSAAKISPGNPRAYLGMGVSALNIGDLDLAETALMQALTLSHPARNVKLEALNNLVIIKVRSGDRNSAIGLLREILTLDPDNKHAIYNLADLLVEEWQPGTEEFNEGLQLYDRLAALLSPGSQRLLTLKTVIALKIGSNLEAYDALTRIGWAGLMSPGIFELWADLMAGGDMDLLDRALGYFRSTGAEPGEVVVRAADTLYRQGRIEQAAHVLRAGTSLEPSVETHLKKYPHLIIYNQQRVGKP